MGHLPKKLMEAHTKNTQTSIDIRGKTQDFHFLLQDPRTLELIFKPREAQRIIDLDTFLKGF